MTDKKRTTDGCSRWFCSICAQLSSPVTPLGSRTFGLWNILSAALRITCAYDMYNARYVWTMCCKRGSRCDIAGCHYYTQHTLNSASGFCLTFTTPASIYHLTLLSFVIALAHFVSECTVTRTAELNSQGIVSPLIVACECGRAGVAEPRRCLVDSKRQGWREANANFFLWAAPSLS